MFPLWKITIHEALASASPTPPVHELSDCRQITFTTR
jgi:hypothetical protein